MSIHCKTLFRMRVSFFTFLAVLLSSLILSKEEGSIDGRIINGKNAERGQFPFQARCVQKTSSGSLTFCGGSILSDTWILSAAHCAINAAGVTVYLGIINLKNLTGVFTTYVNANGIFIHPLYNKAIQNYDIALYRLNSSIPFSKYPYIKTISLPSLAMSNVSYFDNYNGTISGWGATNNAGNSPLILQWAPAHIMPHAQCVKSNRYPITENMICTDKSVINTGMCPGDSGGPLAVTTKDGILRVVGAGSWISAGCNSTFSVQYGYPGSSAALSWIIGTTGIQPK